MKVLWLRAGTGLVKAGPGSQVAAETRGLVTTDTGDQAPAAGDTQPSPHLDTHTYLPPHNCNTSRINDHTVSP